MVGVCLGILRTNVDACSEYSDDGERDENNRQRRDLEVRPVFEESTRNVFVSYA